MRKTRWASAYSFPCRFLRQRYAPVWTSTETASAANTPPAISSRNSAFSMIATVPSAPPIASAPVSPMKTWAGWALNHRNPSAAPASAPQNTVSSPAPGRKYTPTYLVQSNRPNTYAKIANAPAAIAVSPVARPSSPSVKFTAFELPVTTSVTNSTYVTGQNTISWYLNTGSWVDVGGRLDARGDPRRNNPSARPNEIWPISFQRATSPCDLPRTILR